MSQSSILVGGQAVIEGVMMRVPGAYATAVRDPEGKIQVDRHNFISATHRFPFLKKPFLVSYQLSYPFLGYNIILPVILKVFLD